MRNLFPFLQHGVSSELQSIFELLETTEIDGQTRYGARGHQKLMLLVVCRNYSKALLELSYLVVMVVNGAELREARKRILYHFFFGISPATANQYRYHFLQNDGEEGQLHRIEVEGGSFSIYFSRMPILVELMELLMTLLDYNVLEEALSPLLDEQSISVQQISDVANSLSSHFYRVMEHHLPAAQQQRKYQQIARYMLDRYPQGFGYHQIGDDEVLDFWKVFNGSREQSGEDFVKYASVLGGFMDFYFTSRTVAELEQRPEIVQFDEVAEREVVEGLYTQIVEEEEPLLERFGEFPLAQVKFINKRELEQLQWLFSSQQSVVEHFMRSMFRSRLFGAIQNQLIERLRRGKDGKEEVARLMEENQSGYLLLLEQDRKLDDFIERLIFASIHPLFQHNRVLGDWGALLEAEESEWNLRKRARSEFAKISRKGFESGAGEEQIESFIAAVPLLSSIRKRLANYLQQVEAGQEVSLEQCGVEDQVVFQNVLQSMYGARS